jgi:hypothetical protein
MSEKIVYTVWVGGTEVNDRYLKSEKEAEKLADKYKKEGYDDVRIFEIGYDLGFDS